MYPLEIVKYSKYRIARDYVVASISLMISDEIQTNVILILYDLQKIFFSIWRQQVWSPFLCHHNRKFVRKSRKFDVIIELCYLWGTEIKRWLKKHKFKNKLKETLLSTCTFYLYFSRTFFRYFNVNIEGVTWHGSFKVSQLFVGKRYSHYMIT